jgi:hypothetical protein
MGQLLDRAFRLYRNHFVLFVGIVALCQIPLGILNVISSIALADLDPNFLNRSTTEALTTGLSFITLGLGSVFIMMLTMMIGTAVIAHVIADHYSGKTLGILEAYRKLGRAHWSVVGTSLLYAILLTVLFLIALIPCIGWIAAIPGYGFTIFSIVAIIPLTAPVIALEQKRAGAAFSRAWALVRRRFWWVFWYGLLVWIMSWCVLVGPSLLTQTLFLGVLDYVGLTAATIIQQLINFLVRILIVPIPLACYVLLYFDLRIRTEGFDIALLTAVDPQTPTDVAQIAADTPTVEAPSGPTGKELGYFALIPVGFVALAFGIGGIFVLIGLALGATFGGL